MKHLQATRDTVDFGFYDGTLQPVLEIESGEEIIVSETIETVACTLNRK